MVEVKKDLTGMTFGRLTVIGRAEDYVSPKGYRKAQWYCQCGCHEHKIVVVYGNNLTKKKNATQSCGCLRKEAMATVGIDKRKGNKTILNLSDEYGLYGIGYCSNTGREFYFDMDDYNKIKNYTWIESVSDNNYHYLCAYDPDSKKIIKMHHLIVDKYYDHYDRNALNNRKYNLRKVTANENAQNATLRIDNKSGFSGVYWHKKQQRWHAYIRDNGKRKHIGSFLDKQDAIKARLKAELEYYKDSAPQRHLFKEYGII